MTQIKQTLEFFVAGRARPRGSKRAFCLKDRTGTPTGRAVLVDMGKDSKKYMESVRQAAATAMLANRLALMTGPVLLSVRFTFCRPKSHFGTGRNSDKLKASSPACHAQKPDLSKLIRGIEDAMTGIVYRDDSQIVQYDSVAKVWADPTAGEGCEVIVRELDE